MTYTRQDEDQRLVDLGDAHAHDPAPRPTMKLYPVTPKTRDGYAPIELHYADEHRRRIAHIHLVASYRMARAHGLTATAARYVILGGIEAANYSTQTNPQATR